MDDVLLLCWRDTGHPQGGGSERYVERVAAHLAARGLRVTVRTARYPGAPRRETRAGYTISRGGGRWGVYPRALVAIAAARWGLGPLRGIHPDVVVDTQNGVPFFARLVSRAPVVLLVHHGHRELWPVAGRLLGRIGWWIESSLSPLLHRTGQYLTVSLPSAEELSAMGIPGNRIAVVRGGVDRIPRDAVCARAERPRLVVLSRLVPHKRIEDALRAVAALRPRIPDLDLDVIGSGWWEPNLRAAAARLRIEDVVHFHGHVSETRKHELLARAWLHVLPSRKEGWGLAVMEAAQHGVPTVGYRDSRGLTDSIVDGVTGFLVDDWKELVEAVATLLLDHEQRQVSGMKAQARSREFSWPQCADGVFTVLAAATSGRPVSGLINAEDGGPTKRRTPRRTRPARPDKPQS